MANISDECIIGLDTMRMFKMILDVGKGMVGVNGKVLPGCFKYVGGAEVPLYPVETVRRVELEPSSVTKIPVTVKGDPKGCWILEPGFPDCRFFMPSAVMGPSKEGYVWVINEDKMYVPEGTIMGIGQDWEEEEHEIVEYSEPMGAVRGFGEGIPEHIKDMFDRASARVGEDEAVALKLLLIKYRGVFAERVGRHLLLRGRRKKHLKKLLDAGIISRGVSEWASPTVLVRKRDGTVRYCIDLRKVNEVTVKDRYPLAKISECIDALAGCEYFSCLDMANGYYQIKMEGEDRDKTTFVTKYGQFVFNRMHQGHSVEH